MHKFLSLTRVTLKNTIGMMSDGKAKSKSTFLLYGLIALCLLPTTGLVYALFRTALEMFIQIDQGGSVLALAFYASSLVTFVFSIFLIPSVFYFSKDSGVLLSLPIRAEAILGSKFIVCLLYEYVFTLFILVPAFVAYANVVSLSISFVIQAVIITILIPIYPLVFSSIISMLVMRFVPFFKNRDRFNLISGFATIIIAFGFSFTFNSATLSQDPTSILTDLLSGHNSMIEMLGYFIPSVPFAGRAIADNNLFSLLIFIIITLLSLVVCMLLGKAVYFKGLIGFSETNSTRKTLSNQEITKQSLQKNRIITYTCKELKLLIRTPIYAMNCIGTALIFPVLLLIMPLLSGGNLDTSLIPASVIAQLVQGWPYMISIGIVLGIFVSNLNLISSTAISREGSNISFMKYIPMPLEKQLHAKALSGIVISVITSIFMIVAFYIIVPILPIWMLLILFISSIAGIVLGNYIGLYIDILHPKLVWEQEAAAVKQNMTGMIAMMGSWAIAAILGWIVFHIPYAYITASSISIIIFMSLLSVVLYRGVKTIASKAFVNYY